MNILPLIFVFLTILSLTSYSFINQRSATTTEKRSYVGYMNAERLSRNSLESKKFQKIGSAGKSSQEKSLDPKAVYVSPRIKNPPSEASRLSISLLFTPKPPQLLYETSAKLIRILYQDKTFFKEAKINDLEYRILDLMIEKAGKEEPDSFTELFPQDPFFQEIFYKMLKGTNRYQLDKNQGYPPLEDYLTLDRNNRKSPVLFAYASLPLLQSLFNEKFALAIIEAEEKKWEQDQKHHTITESEFSDLFLKKANQGLLQTSLKELLEFSTKRPPAENFRHTDKNTSITIKKPSIS